MLFLSCCVCDLFLLSQVNPPTGGQSTRGRATLPPAPRECAPRPWVSWTCVTVSVCVCVFVVRTCVELRFCFTGVPVNGRTIDLREGNPDSKGGAHHGRGAVSVCVCVFVVRACVELRFCFTGGPVNGRTIDLQGGNPDSGSKGGAHHGVLVSVSVCISVRVCLCRCCVLNRDCCVHRWPRQRENNRLAGQPCLRLQYAPRSWGPALRD